MRTIISAQGIGDWVWIAQKLINQKEKFDWIMPVNHGSAVEKRAVQLEKLFPILINTMTYQKLNFRRDVAAYSYKGRWSNLEAKTIYLEANSHLEAGKRIEDFLPDLPTSFILPFETSIENAIEASNLLERFEGHKVCGIYTSNHAKARDSWMEEEWTALIKMIKKYNPDYKFVFIGADYDRPLTESIYSKLDKDDYVTCIEKELGTAIEVLKRLDIFIGFQSGLTIINELIGAKQTVMLYWNDQAHSNIINSWADPKRIESGNYKGCHFCAPELIFKWLIDNNKL